MRNQLQEPSAEEIRPILGSVEVEQVPVSATALAPRKRFDKLYASAALYVCLFAGLAVVLLPLAGAVGSYLSRLLPEHSSPVAYLSFELGTILLAAIVVGILTGKRIRSAAPTTGRMGIALGGMIIYGAFFLTYLLPLYQDGFRRHADVLSWAITIVDSLIFAVPHLVGFVVFSRKSIREVRR